jgi:hypothetical protein
MPLRSDLALENALVPPSTPQFFIRAKITSTIDHLIFAPKQGSRGKKEPIFEQKALPRAAKIAISEVMKLLKIKSYDPVTSLRAHYLNSGERELKRCGMLPELFADEKGRIFVLKQLKTVMMADHPAVKYRGNTLMVRHLVMDAWQPGWDNEGVLIIPKNGDPEDTSPTNLEVATKGRGRPRNNKILKQLVAVEMLQVLAGDVETTAEELNVSPLFVEQAVRTWAPYLLAPEDRNMRSHGTPAADVEVDDDE